MPPAITCVAALNPCFNVSGVESLIELISVDLKCFDDAFATKAKEQFNKSLEGNPMTQLLNRLKENSNKRAINDSLTSNEYERYVTTDFISHLLTDEFATFDVLGFWKSKASQFPVLSGMARDILSVQATLVASEFAVSTSGRVLSIQRTRLTPASLEMYFEETILDEEVLANETLPLSDEEITLDEAAFEARSNGSGDEIEITSD
nr:zinc finger BED domain-containing protein RICESLEEPER 2-like [Tanacetum cinerariifolium]